MNYPDEVLDEDADDGTMVASKQKLAEAVIGHRIVSVEEGPSRDGYAGLYGGYSNTVLILDNGQRVRMRGVGDCCAYTELDAFLLHPEKVNHVITGVGTTDEYTKWHIFADAGDVLELTVGWSCGNPFYYSYGFEIEVEDTDGSDVS